MVKYFLKFVRNLCRFGTVSAPFRHRYRTETAPKPHKFRKKIAQNSKKIQKKNQKKIN